MAKVILQDWMTLDAVVQAPGDPDEDTSGGFRHGGWSLPYFEETAMNWVVETLNGAAGFLLGRWTYELFAAHWPNASEEERPLSEPLGSKPKHVASRTLTEPLGWQNSTLLKGDASEAVRELKNEADGYLLVIGSVQLAQTLILHDLVDEFRFMIDPIAVGGGKRLFPEDGEMRRFELVDGQVTGPGAILATYVPARG
jgi:dihydrofolate reductase